MKIMQILNGVVHWQTPYGSLSETVGKYAPDIQFIEAPDTVFEGWGYDETQTGDARFIQPETPEGWAYDAATGTFYPVGEDLLEWLKTPEQKQAEYVAELEEEVLELYYELVLTENGLAE